MILRPLSLCSALALAASAGDAQDTPPAGDAAARADATLARMTPEDKTVLTHGIMPLRFGPNLQPLPPEAIPGAGYVAGSPRLGVPSLRKTDASLGVAWVGGIRKDGATALPSGLSMASTWNPELIEQGGRMIGGEARCGSVWLRTGAEATPHRSS